MALCSLQVDSSSAFSGTSVAEIPFRNLLGLNQQTYERLKAALSLNLRRQIFIAVCDDLPLRDRLAVQLQAELAHFTAVVTPPSATGPAEPRAIPRLVTLDLDLNDPNPLAQIAAWMSYFPHGKRQQSLTPAFQVLGVERLTRQSAAVQSIFLSYLQTIEQELPLIESYLLIWMTQPWFRMLPEAAPEFWRCRTGVFEFLGDPTPLPVTSPERIQLTPPGLPYISTRDLPNPPPSSPNRSDQPPQSSAMVQPSENPWLPLAEDLNLWYEPDPEQPNGDGPSLQFDRWMTAFSQILDQDCNALDSQSAALLQQADLLPQAVSFQAVSVATQLPIAPLLQPAKGLSQNTESQETESQETESQETESQETESQETEKPNPQLSDEEILSFAAAALQETLAAEPAFSVLQHIELLQQQIAQLEQGQESPLVLATAYRTLGNFYRDCIEQGEATAQNLTIAVQAYEQALQWLPEDAPEQAEVLNDLGSLYWMIAHLQADTEEGLVCLQRTVQIYQLALHHLDPQHDAQTYAMVQNNLGAAHADLACYQNPTEHLQRSIDAYQQVLRYRTAAADPLRYASTQNNLGTTYWNLAQHQQPEANLKQAITAYSAALHYYDAAQDPLNYAMIQNNLGTAYWNLAQYGQAQDYLTLALAAYRSALQYRTLETAPAGFAATQNNLGTAHWHLANHMPESHDRLTHLQQAILAYEATLEAAAFLSAHSSASPNAADSHTADSHTADSHTADSHTADSNAASLNFDIAATQNNLGLAHYQLATDPGAGLNTAPQSHHLEAALRHHVFAFQAWESNRDLQETAFSCIVQAVRAFYAHLGLPGQNQALSLVPSHLLPDILPRL